MKKQLALTATVVATLTATAVFAASGEDLFKKHCSACHPDGGNVVNPKKTLSKKALAKSGIKTPQAIVKVMRNPEPGMAKFDKGTVPDKEAKAIAEYVLKTFK